MQYNLKKRWFASKIQREFSLACLHGCMQRCIVHKMSYLIACVLAVVQVAAQAWLTRVVSRASSGTVRALLLSIKLPLWVGFFIALTACGKAALLLGAGVAIGGYLLIAGILCWRLYRRQAQK